LVVRSVRALAWPLLFVVLATAIYVAIRVKRDLVDFEVYRTAAARAAHAEPLYREDDGHWQFKYLPAFAIVTAPIAWIDPEITKALWFALSCGLIIWLFRRSVDLLPDRRRAVGPLLAIAAFVTAKLWGKELIMGQTNIWLAVLVMASLAAVRRGRMKTAGMIIGLGMFVKVYALIFLPWLAIAAGVPALLAFGVTLVAGLALPALVYGWHGNIVLHQEWWRTVTETTTPNLLYGESLSTASFWAKWIGVGPQAAVFAAVTSLALVAMVLSIFVRRRRVPEPSYLEVAALAMIIPILSPQGWDYVMMLGIPATMALIDRWRDVSVPWRLVTGLAVLVTGFTLFDIVGRRLYILAMQTGILVVAAILLTACVVHLRWRDLA
jgi:hypothetical protein